MDIERLRALLGAGPETGTEQVTLVVPSVTRSGDPVDQVYWREATLETFGQLFRGATAYPPGRGVWRDDAADDALVLENIVIVYSIVTSAVLDDEAIIKPLVRFIRRLRIETDQGEVFLMIGDLHLPITKDPVEDE